MMTSEQFESLSIRVYHQLDLEWGKGWNHLSDRMRQALFVEDVTYYVMTKADLDDRGIMDTLNVMISKYSPIAKADPDLTPKEVVPKKGDLEVESIQDRTVRQTLIRLSSMRKVLDDPDPSKFFMGMSLDIRLLADSLLVFLEMDIGTARITPDLKSVKAALDGYDFEKIPSSRWGSEVLWSFVNDLYGISRALKDMAKDPS